MNPEDTHYLLRKWTKEEREIVLKLSADGLKPKAISVSTGFPIDQVKYWVYGPRSTKPRKSQKHAASALRAYYRDKYTNWIKWKSHTLRSGFLQRMRKIGVEKPVPSRQEIEDWLSGRRMICTYCEVSLTEKTFGVDHRIPISRGGDFGFLNITESCHSCNLVKGQMNDDEYLLFLKVVSTFEDGGRSLKARLKRGFFRK